MHLKPISNSLRRKLYSVKYRKGSARDEEYSGEFESNAYGGGMGRGGYSPEYENGMMSGIGGGTYYDGTNGRGGGHGGSGRDRNDERGGRDRSGDRGSKRGRHDRESGRRRH